MAMNLEKEKKAIRAEAERELGYPLVQELWGIVEEDVGNAAEDFDGDPEGQEEYLELYRKVVEKYVTVLGFAPHHNKISTDGDGERTPHPKRRYRKCLERRFYLVNFVMDRPYKRGTRIDWKPVVAEWNKSHPSDLMQLSTLRVEYQHAIKEDTLMLQVYITRNNQLLTNLWQPLKKQLKDMQKYAPMSYAITSLVGQKLWNDTQPLISLLAESIKKPPMFKEIEVQNPEQATRLESELEAIANSGDLKPLVEEAGEKTGNSDKVKDNEAEKPGEA
jgi:hypothetical protein